MQVKTGLFLLSILLLFLFNTSAQPIEFKWTIKNAVNGLAKQSIYRIKIGIYKDIECNNPVYIEKQSFQFKGDSVIAILIGKGIPVLGNIDSVMWSEGYYYLGIFPDTVFRNKDLLEHKTLMRVPSVVKPDNLEGIIDEKAINESGEIVIPFSNKKRPKKISVDLTSSYVNLAYPGDKYPIYRHYEWYDEDGDGLGNAFTLSYSENTKHAFFENTHKLGEVKLYAQPFQNLELSNSNKAIVIRMSKPMPLENHGQTFAIKGPWRIIYLIEW